MEVLKSNNLTINRLLNMWLKGICSHADIVILIPITCWITSLGRGKLQYTAFRVGIKDIVWKCLDTQGLFLKDCVAVSTLLRQVRDLLVALLLLLGKLCIYILNCLLSNCRSWGNHLSFYSCMMVLIWAFPAKIYIYSCTVFKGENTSKNDKIPN